VLESTAILHHRICSHRRSYHHHRPSMSAAKEGRVDAEPRRRGVAHLIFLHYTSFAELSVHRASAERAADRFASSGLEAAFRSVINATSRKRSTHEIEYSRLRGAALRRQQKERRRAQQVADPIPSIEEKPHSEVCIQPHCA
jgi:hypothetical protein